MVTTDQKTALPALRARIDERFIAPLKTNAFANRTWFLVAVAAVFALHAGLLGALLYRDWTAPPKAAQEQETPIEVVTAPPPPPPPAPKQSPQQEIEKPATSAPRAESDAKLETDKTDTQTRAPKAETPPAAGRRQQAEQTNTDMSEDADAEAAAENPDIQKDAEALDKAAPKVAPEKPKAAKAKVAARPKPARSPLKQLAGLSDLPDYHFAKRTKKSPVSGGTEDSRYLAIVYGLISSHIHYAHGEGSVTVTFELDESGNVLDIGLLSSSGDQMAEAEVINAVRGASPFPPPPPDRPHSLRATIDFSRHPMSMGAR